LVTRRRGASSLGCLFSLLIGAVVIYFGINVGEAYWRYYQFQDDMRQEVRFAANATNDAILARLKAAADSLGLPDEATDISITRIDKTISVESEYSEHVELPMTVRQIRFHPHADGPL
jgi:hypothetical protein